MPLRDCGFARWIGVVFAWLALASAPIFAAEATTHSSPFPRPLADYAALESPDLAATLAARIKAEPFNLVASIIFLLAICHTFLTAKFRHWAHLAEEEHARQLERREPAAGRYDPE